MRNRVMVVTVRVVVVSAIVCLLSPSIASAAVCTWTGGSAVNGNWSDPANWNVCPAGPQNNDSLVFPAGAQRPDTNNNIAGLVVNTLTASGIPAGNTRYNIGGNGFTVTNGVTLSAPGDGMGNGPRIGAAMTLGGTLTLARSNGGSHIAGAINLNGHQLTIDVCSGCVLGIDGVISGAGVLRKTGDGPLNLFATNTFTGNFQVLAGRVVTFNPSALGASGVGNGTFVAAGSTLTLANINVGYVVPESMTLSGTGDAPLLLGALHTNEFTFEVTGDIVLAGPTRIGVGNIGTNLILRGNISGAGQLEKAGIGRLTLTGNNAYAETVFAAGSLFVNGNQPTVGTDMLATATLLGGTGTMAGAGVKGGTIAPGLSPGILNTASFTLNAGATYNVELAGPNPGAGYDQLNVTGLVSVAGNLTGSVTFAPVAGATFTIVNNDGGDAVGGTFNGLAEGAAFQFGGLPFRITYAGGTGNDIVLNYNPIIIVPTMPGPMLLLLAFTLIATLIYQLRRSPRMTTS